MEHHPPRIGVFFDAPRKIDVMGTQVLYCGIEIVDGKRDDREASRNRIERRKRSALENDQISTIQIKMRAMAIVHQQFKSNDIAIEVCGSRDIFGPQANNGQFRIQGVLQQNKTTSAMKAGRDDEKQKPLGNDLLSREVALQVPSALARLTAGFGMGPGVPTPLKSPRDFVYKDGLLRHNQIECQNSKFSAPRKPSTISIG